MMLLSRSITRHVREEDDLCESRAATLPGRIFRKRRHSRLASPAPQPSVCVDLPTDPVRQEWSPQRVGQALDQPEPDQSTPIGFPSKWLDKFPLAATSASPTNART